MSEWLLTTVAGGLEMWRAPAKMRRKNGLFRQILSLYGPRPDSAGSLLLWYAVDDKRRQSGLETYPGPFRSYQISGSRFGELLLLARKLAKWDWRSLANFLSQYR